MFILCYSKDCHFLLKYREDKTYFFLIAGSKEPGWTPCKSGQSDEQRSARSDEAHRGVETQDRHGDTGTKAGGSQVGITQAVGENAASGMK